MRPFRTLLIAVVAAAGVAAQAGERVTVGPARFVSVLPAAPGTSEVTVKRFRLDRTPVTNAQFLAFVRRHANWRRDRVARLFADERYLAHWRGPTTLGPTARPNQPVTHVSWFAAKAYCAALNARLPTWHEWELAAAANETSPDARGDPAWRQRILAWYAKPSSRPLADVGGGAANVHGIHDLHGLVWEWVLDTNALLVSNDSREQGDPDRARFCGEGALSTADRDNYAVLMRIALLSSLKAADTTTTLGFRCATEAP